MKYSVIIPHHNIPKLLRRAIASIPRREDLEVIVVDDASDDKYKDDIRQMCAEFDAHLIELSKNGGGGKARNEGLKVAKGEFILFLDADDFFNYCIHDILDEYADMPYDIAFFKGNCVDSETYSVGHRLDYLNRQIDAWMADSMKGEEGLRYEFGIPCCRIIRRSLTDKYDIRFDEIRIHDDTTFAYMLGYYANTIIADKRCILCATIREGSVNKQQGANMLLTTVDVLGRQVLFMNKIGRQHGKYGLCCNMYLLLRAKDFANFNNAINNLVALGFKKKEIEKFFPKLMAKDSIKSTIWIILFSPNRNIRWRSLLYLFTTAIPHSIAKPFKKQG